MSYAAEVICKFWSNFAKLSGRFAEVFDTPWHLQQEQPISVGLDWSFQKSGWAKFCPHQCSNHFCSWGTHPTHRLPYNTHFNPPPHPSPCLYLSLYNNVLYTKKCTMYNLESAYENSTRSCSVCLHILPLVKSALSFFLVSAHFPSLSFGQSSCFLVFSLWYLFSSFFLLHTVRKMDLLLRCIQRRLQMQLSMARKFTLQPYRR
jgi:hypothetical protein